MSQNLLVPAGIGAAMVYKARQNHHRLLFPMTRWHRTLRLLVLAALGFLQPMLPAQAQDTAAKATTQDAATALAGWWEEYAPSSNIVQFRPDGTVKVYLKKDEIGTLRTLDGTWKLENDQTTIEMVFTVRERSLTRRAQISFEGPEMVITENGSKQTRHRRHSGQLPAAYNW